MPQTSRAPAPADERPLAVRITPAAERSLRGGHPWLYGEAITRQSQEGAAGDLAVVYDRRNRFLAVGLYDPASPIRVRVLQAHRPARLDAAWYRARLADAIGQRRALQKAGITGYRLVHGENDGLPGLILDRYDTTLVLKLYTAAWVPHLPLVREALDGLVPCTRLVLRMSRTMAASRSGLQGMKDGMILSGSPIREPVVFQEHGLRFEVDPLHGHKTGFFLDQRDNRVKTERLCRGASVLDVFAYTGAFSAYAARGGAREVMSVDLSRQALAATGRNMARNRRDRRVAAARHHVMQGDAYATLDALRRRKLAFDVVILDPPAFASTHAQVRTALQAYGRLARLGLGVLRPGGTLITSSCSSHVSATAFFAAVHQGARAGRRHLRELERTGHPIDHPVRFPEGAYLKCLFATA